MNEHKLSAPKDAKPGEIKAVKAIAGVVYVWKGDVWQATLRPEHAEKFLEMLKQEQSR